MTKNIFPQIYKKFIWSSLIFLAILFIGTMGYWLIAGKEYSLLDCLYMTMITISTIGYAEIIPLSGHAAGRIFTMFIALSGIGILTYFLSNFTAFVVEGQIKETFRRNKMVKIARKMKDHFIVCGIGRVGHHIVDELRATKRPCIIVEVDKNKIEKNLEVLHDQVILEGDGTDNNTLLIAGITKAAGLFAVTGDDNRNLVISLTAKQLNPKVKVVASCKELNNIEKVRKAGADAVISPTHIGALRMASEMLRPTVVSFLDTMLRDKDKNFRVEEITLPDVYVGRTISTLNLKNYPHTLLLAIKTKEDWIYNPSADYTIKPENALIVMTTPEERMKLEDYVNSSARS